MVIYEVNLSIDADVAGPFTLWLKAHVEVMLRFEGFVRARILSMPDGSDGSSLLTVWYEVRDGDALESYFKDGAEAMRADGLARFGGRFRATRRILQVDSEMLPT